jgi:putative CocE/NonD family hydrolase
LDHWLKGGEEELPAELPPVRLFVTGANEWRDFTAWPPTEAEDRTWYLRSGGHANSRFGNGALSATSPGQEAPDRFDYNPDDPVPTLGGQHIAIPDCPPGPVDQRPLERRDDVLVYTSAPLTEPLVVVGEVRARLSVASSAPDTDFTAKLVDVWPDGRAFILTDGVLRARFRAGDGTDALLEPGEVYELSVEVGALAHTFLPGHCIRLDVSSSNFPKFSRNLNTGESPGTGERREVAHQTVFHDAGRASQLILPVL